MKDRLIISGFGGQGVMLLGQFLAYAGMLDGKRVSWIPSYGPEMRGGTAYCSVVISDTSIASPVVSRPDTLIVMNSPSLDRFLPAVRRYGIVVANSSMIGHIPKLDRDIHLVSVPAQSIAEELGAPKASNMVMLGCYLGIRGGPSEKAVEAALQKAFVDAVKRPDLIPINRAAIERGRELAQAGNEND